MRILIVDDSVVMRSQIKSSLDGIDNIEVVATANNGKIALQKLEQSSVDLVVLDMEMPELNGLETIKAIKLAKFKVRILVFSAYTKSGSELTLDALAAGADDFITKPSGPDMSLENATQKIREQLLPKILQFSSAISKAEKPTNHLQKTNHSAVIFPKKTLSTFLPSAIVIGSSTGGPPALEKVLAHLVKPLRVPIFITQHMPPVFTQSFAKRLEHVTGISCDEAKHDEIVETNKIYIAPGDYHMKVVKTTDGLIKIQLDQGPQRNSVRPAVDHLFESAALVYGARTMGIVLTGMGEDGLVGAKAIKDANGGILIQDQASCVVFGMPGAIYNARYFDEVGNLTFINNLVQSMVK